METGTRRASNIPCLVCSTFVLETVDGQSLSSSSTSCSDDSNRNTVRFLLRNLLEIPKPLVKFVASGEKEKSREDSGQCSRNICSRFLVSCVQCKESIKQASLIYGEIRELAQTFRGIQKKIVETFKKHIGASADAPDEVRDIVEYYRKLVNDCDYNGFGFPFIVQDEEENVERGGGASSANNVYGPEGNEDDLDLRKSKPCEVIVKQEKNDDTDSQEILLIFPEGEEDGDDQDDHDNHMDSEEEEDDSDDQVSLINSEEKLGDSDDQVSPMDSEEDTDDDDQVSEVDSETEEDDDDDQIVDLPQNLHKTGDLNFQEEADRKSCSRGELEEATTQSNVLSSFICKKCLKRFKTPAELEKHHKSAHSKEHRETFPCPLEGCSRVYTYAGILPKHFKMHHRKPPFNCKDCKNEFSNPDQVRIHHKQSHPPQLQQQPKKPEETKGPKKSAISPKNPVKAKTRPRQTPNQPSKVPGRRGRGRPRKHQQEQPKKPPNPFPCPLCHRSLIKFSSLRAHMKRSHPDNSIPLNELRLKYLSPPPQPNLPEERESSKAKFKHLGISTFEVEYPHIICERNPQGKFPCPWTEPSPCPRIFLRKERLQQHIKVNHLNLPLYTCTWSGGKGEGGPVCGKSFATRTNYVEHYDEHRGTPGFKCEDCQKTFYKRNPFVRHRQLMHFNEMFMCEMCGRGFPCKDYLYVHKNMSLKQKRCQQQVKTGTGTEYKKPTADKKDVDEENGPGIICDLCGKVLKNQTTLKKHIEAVHEKIPGKYCCHLCDNRYRVITHLNIHLWERHKFKAEGYQPKERKAVARKDKFQCPVVGCKMIFLKKENLENHRLEMHGEDGNKPGQWNCKFCGKNFFQKIKWAHCVKTHENKESRPEKCEVCGKGFPTKHHLRFHQKYTHKMELESKRGQREQNWTKIN